MYIYCFQNIYLMIFKLYKLTHYLSKHAIFPSSPVKYFGGIAVIKPIKIDIGLSCARLCLLRQLSSSSSRRSSNLLDGGQYPPHLLQCVVVEESKPGVASVTFEVHHDGEAESVEMSRPADDAPSHQAVGQLWRGQSLEGEAEGGSPPANVLFLRHAMNDQAGDF